MGERRRNLKTSDELAIRTHYENCRHRLLALADSIKLVCESVLNSNSIPYHSVKIRIKSLSSTLEKIIRKSYKPSLDYVSDLVGIRIICLYPKHVEPIIEFLEHEFSVLERVDKRPEPDPKQFGYSSIHLVCKIKGKAREVLPEYKAVDDTPFEIQVRTILQESWAEIEHRLIYKSEVAAPEEIKRLIVRVSALLEVADKEFQEVYDKREAYIVKLKAADLSAVSNEPLNIDSLLEIIRRKYPWADGWDVEHGHTLGEDLTELLSEMQKLNITKVDQLAPIIDKWNKKEYQESERAYFIATEQKPQEREGDECYEHIEIENEWHSRTKQYFLPVGQIRGILKREFPHYSLEDSE